MKIELSFLFGMEDDIDWVTDEHIGDGVYVQDIQTNGELQRLKNLINERDEFNYKRLCAREQDDITGDSYTTNLPFTHRFFSSVEAPSTNHELFQQMQQRIIRAIILSRIIKPLPIPINPTVIINEGGQLKAKFSIGFYSSAYILPTLYLQSFRTSDASLISKHWRAFENIHNRREKGFERVWRAINYFNDAYHINPAHLRHVVLHAALETLICTSTRDNKNQVVQRFPQIIAGITEQEVIDSYDLCCGIKHAAEPALLGSADSGTLTEKDSERIRSMHWLDESLRKLLIKLLQDNSLAELLEDKERLESSYPVTKK